MVSTSTQWLTQCSVEFIKDYIVSKKLDHKVMDHPDFETVCSRYW